MAKIPETQKWPAAFRASILSATMQKSINYVGIFDKRAQALVTINALLIPISLAGLSNPAFRIGIIVVILTAIASTFCAVLSLLPKRYKQKSDMSECLLHFTCFEHLNEAQYIAHMGKALEKTDKLGQMAASDIFHMGKFVLAPKLTWLRRSYWVFLVGYSIALLSIVFQIM